MEGLKLENFDEFFTNVISKQTHPTPSTSVFLHQLIQ